MSPILQSKGLSGDFADQDAPLKIDANYRAIRQKAYNPFTSCE